MLNDNINKKNPFSVPQNYFENFNVEMMAKLPQKEVAPKKVFLWKSSMPWIAGAAMLGGVLLSVSIALQAPQSVEQTNETHNNNIAKVGLSEDDDFYKYIEEQSVNAQYKETLLSSETRY